MTRTPHFRNTLKNASGYAAGLPFPTVTILDKLKALQEGLNEFYAGPYRSTFAKAGQQEEDLFMLLVMGEALGIDNPASYYTMELLPIIYEDFHAWHLRMGMEHSPLENFSCC